MWWGPLARAADADPMAMAVRPNMLIFLPMLRGTRTLVVMDPRSIRLLVWISWRRKVRDFPASTHSRLVLLHVRHFSPAVIRFVVGDGLCRPVRSLFPNCSRKVVIRRPASVNGMFPHAARLFVKCRTRKDLISTFEPLAPTTAESYCCSMRTMSRPAARVTWGV